MKAGVIISLESIVEPIPWDRVFRAAQPLEVELGSGDGGFLVEWAARNPGLNCIGVERLLGRLRKVERKAVRRQLLNLRAVRIEASYFLQYLLPERSVSALHVYFPDPWPKRKHWRYRLVNDRFPALAARVLAPGGMVYFRTDHPDYFAQMTGVFQNDSRFVPGETPTELAALPTDFEREFRDAGIAILRAAYQCLAAPLSPATPSVHGAEAGVWLP